MSDVGYVQQEQNPCSFQDERVISNVVIDDIGLMLIFDKPDVFELMFLQLYLEHQVSAILKFAYY